MTGFELFVSKEFILELEHENKEKNKRTKDMSPIHTSIAIEVAQQEKNGDEEEEPARFPELPCLHLQGCRWLRA